MLASKDALNNASLWNCRAGWCCVHNRGLSVNPLYQVVFWQLGCLKVVLEQQLWETGMCLDGFLLLQWLAAQSVQVLEESRCPELNMHIWDFAGQLHGRSDHVHALPTVAQREEDVPQKHQWAGGETVQVFSIRHLERLSQVALGIIVAGLEEGIESMNIIGSRS